MSGIEAQAVEALAKMLGRTTLNLIGPLPEKEVVNVRREQLTLLQELSTAGIDPKLFDLLLSNELDRNLKRRFGYAFFVATLVFTAASYGVIVLNGIFRWGVSEVAITALIVETPIQFIGLLYIIARNLFPQRQTPAYIDPEREDRRAGHRPVAARDHRAPAAGTPRADN